VPELGNVVPVDCALVNRIIIWMMPHHFVKYKGVVIDKRVRCRIAWAVLTAVLVDITDCVDDVPVKPYWTIIFVAIARESVVIGKS